MRIVIAAVLCTVLSAHAQMNKCVLPNGKVEYRDSACEDAKHSSGMSGGTVNNVAPMSRGEMQRAQQMIRAEQQTRPAQAYIVGGGDNARRVPTEQEIKNLETSASSTTIGAKERAFLQDEVRRAKAARDSGAAYTQQQLRELNDAQASQSRIDHKDRATARRDAEAVHMESGTPGVKAQILVDREAQATKDAARRAAAVANVPRAPGVAWCNGGGCWIGNTHLQAGPNGNYTGAGKSCWRRGDQLTCN